MGYYDREEAARAIMRRNIRHGNVYVHQVLFEGDWILVDIEYSGRSYSRVDLDSCIYDAGTIADSYDVKMKWSLSQAY